MVETPVIRAGREYDFDGFRGEMYGGKHTFDDLLDDCLEELSVGAVEDVVASRGYGPSIREDVTEESSYRRASGIERYISFTYDIDTDEYLYTPWNRPSRWFCVYSGRGGNIECWGLLADPLKTEDAGEMAEHIEEQIVEVRKRLNVLLELERVREPPRDFYSTESYEDCSENKHSSIIRASGIGQKSEERLVQMFGVPSNILMYMEPGVKRCASTAYGNKPDVTRVVYQVIQAVKNFKKYEQEGKIDCEYSIEDLQDYPKTPTLIRQSGMIPHTSDKIDL